MAAGHRIYQTKDVFGVTTDILELSYVDRGALDEELAKYLQRDTHIALKGESKCGKSWLRKRNIPNALVVQCRLNRTVNDLYVDALSQLGVKLTLETSNKSGFKGTAEGSGEVGFSLLAKVTGKASSAFEKEGVEKSKIVGHDVTDLRFVADVIRESGRRLVIEDFHYLARQERKSLAFDLKALWDYKAFVVIIGIWPESNLLSYLNSDLTGRVHEMSIYWSKEDLQKIIDRGSEALHIKISPDVAKEVVNQSFGTAGILQTLMLKLLDTVGIVETVDDTENIHSEEAFESAAMSYAEQLNAVYQTFASRVAKGIRSRKDSTGIYAHSLAVILRANDDTLSKGMHLDEIFTKANEREPRVKKGNLRTVLEKMDELQIDNDGRGLIISYDSHTSQVGIVDKQLLLYRRYATVNWPWERIIESEEEPVSGFEAEDESERK